MKPEPRTTGFGLYWMEGARIMVRVVEGWIVWALDQRDLDAVETPRWKAN